MLWKYWSFRNNTWLLLHAAGHPNRELSGLLQLLFVLNVRLEQHWWWKVFIKQTNMKGLLVQKLYITLNSVDVYLQRAECHTVTNVVTSHSVKVLTRHFELNTLYRYSHSLCENQLCWALTSTVLSFLFLRFMKAVWSTWQVWACPLPLSSHQGCRVMPRCDVTCGK